MSKCCSDRRLRAVLTGSEGDDEELIVRHLDDCAECQSRLLAIASGDKWQDEIVQALREVPERPDESCTSSIVLATDNSLAEDIPAACEPVSLDFLGAPSHPEMLGRLGRYEIERVIGAGGMGIVLKGFDSELHRPVAIKVLAPHLAHSGAARVRFAREARAVAAIAHENVLPIHDVESSGKLPYLVMPFVPGQSLQARLDAQGPLPIRDVLRIACQAAEGLAAAHAQGIVHRDVKPANILLEESIDRVRIMDFGLARAADDASVTRSGIIAGTPYYMSPEQSHGEPIDERSDLFSLGSVIYAMCTGKPPFRADSTMGVLRKISDTEPWPLRDENPDVPIWLAALVRRLMIKSPQERLGSAREAADLLQQLLAHVNQPDTHSVPSGLLELDTTVRILARRRPRAWQAILVVGSFLAVIVLLAPWWQRPLDNQRPRDHQRPRDQPRTSSSLSVGQPPSPTTEKAVHSGPYSPADPGFDWIDATDDELRELDRTLLLLEHSSEPPILPIP